METILYLLVGLLIIPVIIIGCILLTILIILIFTIITGKKIIEISITTHKKYKE